MTEHGEVFTAEREVKAMCDLVKQETERIDSRFLEPACGTGNFLTEILARKLSVVKSEYGRSPLEYEKYSLLAVSSLYGVDIMADNVETCRERLFKQWDKQYRAVCKKECNDDTRKSVRFILSRNIVCGNALTLKCVDENCNDTEQDIVFSEWAFVFGSNIQRSDYSFDDLVNGNKEKASQLTLSDRQQRIDHIFKNQLYGIAITELTSLLSRRSLYCSKYADSAFSVTHFENSDGNIRFKRIPHSFDKSGRCIFCGASETQYDRGEEREYYAYEWIHTLHPEEIFGMKFDVIISNPPYQLSDEGNGASAKPIYQYFVETAKNLKPRFLTMIIPARWYAGGKGLDEFRKTMLEDKRIVRIVDYVNAKDCFSGINLGGGICYFLWDRDNPNECQYTNIHDSVVSTETRTLNEFPVFVRYNEAISIIHKVISQKEKTVSEVVGSRNPFGLSSFERGTKEPQEIKLFSSGGTGYIPVDDIPQGLNLINKYKVIISKVTSEHAGEPDKSGMFTVISTTKVLLPKEVCTDSYIILYTTDSKLEADNFAKYVCTKFFRFLLLQSVSSINLSKDKFQFVPMQNFNTDWSDNQLYAKYNLTQIEIDFIESMIKEKLLGGDNNG